MTDINPNWLKTQAAEVEREIKSWPIETKIAAKMEDWK